MALEFEDRSDGEEEHLKLRSIVSRLPKKVAYEIDLGSSDLSLITAEPNFFGFRCLLAALQSADSLGESVSVERIAKVSIKLRPDEKGVFSGTIKITGLGVLVEIPLRLEDTFSN